MKKILIVEDDPFILDITSLKLVEHGYTVITAVDGEKALLLLQNERPDVVLLDLELPSVSGFDVLSHIKTSKELKDLVVIIFSNNSNEEIKKKMIKIGAADFFVKVQTDYKKLFSVIDSVKA